MPADFDDICDSRHSKTPGSNGDAPPYPSTMATLRDSRVSALVQQMALRSEYVLGPLLLNVDQSALTRTVQQMLERGNRHQLIFGTWTIFFHPQTSQILSMTSIPLGRSSAFTQTR